MARSRTWLVVPALLCAGPLAAQDDLDFLDDELDALLAGEDVSDAGSSEPSVLRGVKGFVQLEPRVFLRDRGGEKNDEQVLFEAELELDFRFSDRVTGYFRPRIFTDALDGELERFEPYEAYATWEGDGWDVRAGQFVENWGVVDTYNPIDVINRRDFGTDTLTPDRLGELGFRYRRVFDSTERIGEPTLSLYAMPVFRQTRFAPDDQRIGPGTEALPFDEKGGFVPGGEERGLYAARFQSTLATKWANADVQVLASRGPSRDPAFVVDDGTLVPAYFGANTFGAGLRAVPNEDAAGGWLAALTLKGEVVHTRTYDLDDSPLDDPPDFTTFVFGFDRSFPGLVSDQDELTLTVEYAGETGSSDDVGLLRPFRDDLILRTLYEVNDFARQSVELRGLVDLEVDETVFELVYERQLRSIHEDLKLIVRAQVFDLAEAGESSFGFADDPTSVSVGLRWDF